MAIAAAHRVGRIPCNRWPNVTAHLVALDVDGPAVVELAALPANPSGWLVDQIIPRVLEELGSPNLSAEAAGDIYATFCAHWMDADEFTVIRHIARLEVELDFPGGLVDEAYELEEYIDCECHASGPADAQRFVRRLRAGRGLDLPSPLALVLLGE